jgi:hypothetical protein
MGWASKVIYSPNGNFRKIVGIHEEPQPRKDKNKKSREFFIF